MRGVSERSRARVFLIIALIGTVALVSCVVGAKVTAQRDQDVASKGIEVETKDVEERANTAKDLVSSLERGNVLTTPISTGTRPARTRAPREEAAPKGDVFVRLEDGTEQPLPEEPLDPYLVAQDKINELQAQALVDDHIKRRELAIAADEGGLSISSNGGFGGGAAGTGGQGQLQGQDGSGLARLANALGGGGSAAGIGSNQNTSAGGPVSLDTTQTGGSRSTPGSIALGEATIASVSGYAQNPPLRALSPYEIKKGSVIPAVLVTELVSDNPGIAIGQTTLPVYDSISGRHVLIPSGSKLHGRYGTDVSFGAERIGVAWTHLIFPDGRTLNLENAQGAGANGASGLKDQVDTRFWQTMGFALLTSLIGVGVELIQPEASGEERIADELRRGLGQDVGSALDSYVQKQANLAPRIIIRTGSRFNVVVESDFIVPPLR